MDLSHHIMECYFIKAGEIICVDDPSVSMLCPDIKENIKSHCLHCFRASKAPLPCDVRSKNESFYFLI